MPFIFIDRRKAGKGKSAANRSKLLRRIKSHIRTANPQNIGAGGVSGATAKTSSPVKVTGTALEEPFFAYGRDGDHTAIVIGNSEFDRGDEIDIPDSEEQQGGGSQGENGEDDFVVSIARDEFLNIFYEDCEFPNLINEKFTEKLDNKQQPAGFSTSGNPSQLSIVRSYKQMLGRRRALTTPIKNEIEQLEEELESIYAELAASDPADMLILKWNERIGEIEQLLVGLRRKQGVLGGFDKVDLRYRKKEAKPLKTVDAVLFMLMDISGSMDETKKLIARRWFALLYGFIKRRYPNTELVFIAHTTEAFEMSESDFFSTRMNGGTLVSPAIKMVNQIIKSRYDAAQTNIYVSHASDGDNWDDDNAVVLDEMVGDGQLMKKIQMFSYVEVGRKFAGYHMYGAAAASGESGLWENYYTARQRSALNKVTLSIIEAADDCYDVFKRVFKKAKQ